MHCISIYLIRKSDLRDEKIDNILEDKSGHEIVWTEMHCDILATTNIPDREIFGKGKMIAEISTDYFGGSGSQSAKLFVDNKIEYEGDDEYDYGLSPINDVLKRMYIVKKNGMDEFDTIGLGNYRTNEDFN
jgi:hypothetical protein